MLVVVQTRINNRASMIDAKKVVLVRYFNMDAEDILAVVYSVVAIGCFFFHMILIFLIAPKIFRAF